MPVTELECQNCGAKLEAQPGQVMVKCKYCQTSSHVDWQQLEKPRPQPPVIVVNNGMTARGQKHLALFIVLSAIVPLGIGIVMFVVSMATDSMVSSSSTGLGSFGGTSPSAPASPEAPPPPPLTPEQARASALDVKMTAYVGACLNRLADRALASRARYRSWVPDETGPTPRSRYKYGLYALTNTSDCIQAIESSHAVEPAIEPLDGAAADFARELGTLATIVNEANRYYDRTEYEDDDMAHGAEMHRPLLEAFDRFVAASTALEVAVDPIFDEMMTQRTLSLSESDATNRLRYDSMRIAFEIAAMGNVHWRNRVAGQLHRRGGQARARRQAVGPEGAQPRRLEHGRADAPLGRRGLSLDGRRITGRDDQRVRRARRHRDEPAAAAHPTRRPDDRRVLICVLTERRARPAQGMPRRVSSMIVADAFSLIM